MGTRLRKSKTENKHVQFDDGKGLGGKNRLSKQTLTKFRVITAWQYGGILIVYRVW